MSDQSDPIYPKIRKGTLVRGPSLESHETFRSILGVIIPSSQRQGSKPSNSATLLSFLTLKTCKKISFLKKADLSLTTGFSGPRRSLNVRETGPRSQLRLVTTLSSKLRRLSFSLPLHGPLALTTANKVNIMLK